MNDISLVPYPGYSATNQIRHVCGHLKRPHNHDEIKNQTPLKQKKGQAIFCIILTLIAQLLSFCRDGTLSFI